MNPGSYVFDVTDAEDAFLSRYVLGSFFKVEFPLPMIGQPISEEKASPENSMMSCSLPMGIQTNRKQYHYSPSCKHSHVAKVKPGGKPRVLKSKLKT